MTDCCHWDKDGKPFGQFGARPSEKHKPHKKIEVKKGLAYMTAMLKAIQKGQKKAAKGKKCKKRDCDLSRDYDSE